MPASVPIRKLEIRWNWDKSWNTGNHHSTRWLNDYSPLQWWSALNGWARIKSASRFSAHCTHYSLPLNRSTEDTIAHILHTTLSHLDKKGNYVRLLFIDYSSAFNAINPSRLVKKLKDLGLNTSLCMWILDFLMDTQGWVVGLTPSIEAWFFNILCFKSMKLKGMSNCQQLCSCTYFSPINES